MIPRHFFERRSDFEKLCQEQVNPTDSAFLSHAKRITALTKYVMYALDNDESVGKNLIRDGYWEMWITQFLVGHIEKGWKVIDVGANYGYYTLLMADLVGPEGQVFSVEPQQTLAELIDESIRSNPFYNIQLFDVAVADKAGIANISVNPQMLGNSSIAYEVPGGRQKKIEVTTLDTLFGDTRIDFVKIDAEGSEENILVGMENLIESNPYISILLEWNPAWIKNPEGFCAWAKEHGFSKYLISTLGKAEFISDIELLHYKGLDMILLIR